MNDNQNDGGNIFWVRTFDYEYERDEDEKGIMLDEFYSRDKDKNEIKSYIRNERYVGEVSRSISFKKPKKGKNGIYCLILNSNDFFYHRFYDEIDTLCFCCHKHIKGRAASFPSMVFENSNKLKDKNDKSNGLENIYFCSPDCKRKYLDDVNPLLNEGEFQEREDNWKNNFGYIYCIYNRAENKYYIGQTRYLPFFRWQEHVKSNVKGNIEDLEFKVITTVKKGNPVDSQLELNDAETWWIQKYREDGYDTINISKIHASEYDYKKKYDEMIAKYKQCDLGF